MPTPNAPTVPREEKILAPSVTQSSALKVVSAEVGLGAVVQVVLDPRLHGAVHLEFPKLIPVDPHHLAGLLAGSRLPAHGPCGEQHGELLPGLPITGVEDDVL